MIDFSLSVVCRQYALDALLIHKLRVTCDWWWWLRYWPPRLYYVTTVSYYIYMYVYIYIYKPRQNGRKMTLFREAMGRHGQAGSWRGQWTGWIGSAPVQISGCGLDGALSWCGQGEGQSFLVSSWAARAVAAEPSFQTCFACVHMYILYACVYICVSVYVCGHDICIYMHVWMYLYIYAFIHVCMCMCMHICA